MRKLHFRFPLFVLLIGSLAVLAQTGPKIVCQEEFWIVGIEAHLRRTRTLW
jgi:hypothetical protein